MKIIPLGAFLGALSVILGAFGAHALRGKVGDDGRQMQIGPASVSLPPLLKADSDRVANRELILQNANGVILQLSGPKIGAEVSAAVGGVTMRLK